MKKEPRYKRITPLRALSLLRDANETSWSETYRLTLLKRALEDHVKAALVRGKR